MITYWRLLELMDVGRGGKHPLQGINEFRDDYITGGGSWLAVVVVGVMAHASDSNVGHLHGHRHCDTKMLDTN